MKAPRFVQVGPYRYSVLVTHEGYDEDDRWGECKPASLEVRVKPNLSPDVQREVLWHELKHAVWAAAALPDGDKLDIDDEEVVKRSSPLELAVLRDNPKLVEYLTARP